MYCDNCGKPIDPKRAFTLKIELYATPYRDKNGNIVIEDEASGETLEDLVEKMEKMVSELTEEELAEIADEIAESYKFSLCEECRRIFHKKLKEKYLMKYWRAQ